MRVVVDRIGMALHKETVIDNRNGHFNTTISLGISCW
jgi:hypothetical protein